MRIKKVAGLTNLVVEGLEQSGVTWRDLASADKEGREYVVPLPPFFTDLTLGGRKLQEYADVRLSCEIEDFVAAYEVFIGSYIAGPGRLAAPDRTIGPHLGLPERDAKMLFGRIGSGRPSRHMRDRLILVNAFVALAMYNYGGFRISNHSSFVAEVQHGDKLYKFGIVNGGDVLTNYGSSGVIHSGTKLFHPGDLADLARTDGTVLRSPSLLVSLLAWLDRSASAKKYTDKEGLQLALLLLHWRGGSRLHRKLSSGVREAAAPESWAQAIDLAEKFPDFTEPYSDMYRIFVPNLMTKGEFVKMFGDRPRRSGMPSAARKKLWKMSLNYLDFKKSGVHA